MKWSFGSLCLLSLLGMCMGASQAGNGNPGLVTQDFQSSDPSQAKADGRPFHYLSPYQQRLASLIYSDVLGDSVDHRAMGMTELADVIAKKYPQRATELYRTAFELSMDMPEREWRPLPPPSSSNGAFLRDYQRRLQAERAYHSRLSVQSRIVRALVPTELDLAQSLFNRIETPLPAKQRFQQDTRMETHRIPVSYYDSDPLEYYAAAFKLAGAELKRHPDRAMNLVSESVGRGDFSQFQFLPQWIQSVRQVQPEAGLFWSVDGWDRLKSTTLDASDFFTEDFGMELDGVVSLVEDSLQNYPTLLPTVVVAVLTFSADLEKKESRLAQAEGIEAAVQEEAASHRASRRLLECLLAAVHGKDETLEARIAAHLKQLPVPAARLRRDDQNAFGPWPGWQPSEAHLNFSAFLEKQDLEKASKVIPQIQDPRMHIQALTALAQLLARDKPDVAARRLDEAEGWVDKMERGEVGRGLMDLESATARIYAAFDIFSCSALISPEKLAVRFRRLITSLDLVRAADPTLFESDATIQDYFTTAVKVMAQESLQEAVPLFSEIRNARMRVQATTIILEKVMSPPP